jgi:hypothetical protein
MSGKNRNVFFIFLWCLLTPSSIFAQNTVDVTGDSAILDSAVHPFVGFGVSLLGYDGFSPVGLGLGLGIDVGLENHKMFGRVEGGFHGYNGPRQKLGVSRAMGAPPPNDEIESLEYCVGGAIGFYPVKNIGFGILVLGEWAQVTHFYTNQFTDFAETIIPLFAINLGFEIRARGAETPTTVYSVSFTIRRGLHLGIDFDL